jgi:hypothetical protein
MSLESPSSHFPVVEFTPDLSPKSQPPVGRTGGGFALKQRATASRAVAHKKKPRSSSEPPGGER